MSSEPFEERLLANLDALVSLEQPRLANGARIGLAPELWTYATEWSTPDLGRAFALAFCLACTDDPAAVRWALAALRRAPPRVHRAFEDALSLGSSPTIDEEVFQAVRSEDRPPVLATLLRVAARRGAFDPAVLVPLAHPQTEVARAAISCVAAAPAELVGPALEPLLEGEIAVVIAAATALSARGDGRGARRLREIVARAVESPDDVELEPALEAGTALATLGALEDGPALRRLAVRAPELLPALGNHGDPSHVPLLLDSLDGRVSDPLERGVARALHRLLGAHPEGWSPTTSTGGADHAAWKSVVEAASIGSGRVRRGRDVLPGPEARRLLVEELIDPETVQGDRSRLLRELWICSGEAVCVDLEGFCHQQRGRLGAVR